MSRKLPYKLSDLTAQCDPDAPVPQDMIDWEKDLQQVRRYFDYRA
ncbi:hypothetical protein [Marinobacter sp. BSs20148]|jgi:antitoxin ChpS|nr:hypothetical protein [Marinobacter sp. BSs20148]AFP30842.1 hypothetical protein MRBBS_1905 [Marinobacter sp. BSs20148]